MYRLEYTQNPSSEELKIIFEGIQNHAVLKKNMAPMEPFGVLVKDVNGSVLGGMHGITYYGCLYIDMLWLPSELRSQGIGRQLMLEAEAIGQQRCCSFATVNTMDWEALGFYQKLGYEIEFVREGYDRESKMYLLRKKLPS